MLEAQAQKEVEQRAKDLLRVEWVTEPGHLGQGCAQPNLPKFKKAREDLMERLRLRAKPLPPHMEAAWPAFRGWYVERVVKEKPMRLGLL